ncbi:hypothetical protein [Cylindrospermopsis curvispora]|uniref:Uncharacterized protein n=1 Tax=Cylindrospermopsis curvispora GIHE-G1 TaxID=2666332 RepID=A0A7H0F5Q2_9CYAN|nr:hypothetical protein [Cylindrospermopsis curvispora]KRH97245.1 hypothetical protein ASL19_04845 [Cylindrospermopsis sp. CR12]QNP31368.1 hypothetical protein IAR63_17980 [Cylindrospermopsis curvispora GIHE-G1]
MENIHNLNITDEEYLHLISKGYDPKLESQFIELGETEDQARKLAKVVGMFKDGPPQSDEEWEHFLEVWEN